MAARTRLALECALILALLCAAPSRANADCAEPFQRPAYKTRSFYCQTGQLIPDSYDFGNAIPCELMEVDHLISLKEAWESGICGADLKRLANDPRNLRFTAWQTNRTKGAKSPEDFSGSLPAGMKERVLKDAQALRKEYGILSREELLRKRIQSLKATPFKYIKIPTNLIPPRIKSKITYRVAGKRTLVIIRKRVVGYVVGIGLAIEVLSISYWALDAFGDSSEDIRRANQFRAILSIPLK